MGRRALRKIRAEIDLSGYLLELDDLPKPLDFAALFGNRAPLEVEVGSGKGLFMRTAAARQAGRELSRDRTGPEVCRLRRAVWPNEDGQRQDRRRRWICGSSPNESPGLASRRSMLFSRPLVEDAAQETPGAERAVPGATCIGRSRPAARSFWTDVEEYFKTTLALIGRLGIFDPSIAVPESPVEHDMDYRTHFERRTRQHGEAVYRSEFRKPAE